MQTVNKVAPEVTREREAQAWKLRQRLWTEQRIADELGVHVSTVSRMLDRVERRLAEQLKNESLPIKARQTAQLQEIAAEAFAAWERSKLDAELERTVSEEVNLADEATAEMGFVIPGVKVKTTQERKGQTGDPALLDKAMKALADIRAIWGLETPKKTEVDLNVSRMSDAELIAAAASYLGGADPTRDQASTEG